MRRWSTGTSLLFRLPGVLSTSGSHASTTWRPSVPRIYREFSLMDREPGAGSLPLRSPPPRTGEAASSLARRFLTKKQDNPPTIAISATRPTVIPTAEPAPKPPCDLDVSLCTLGGAVGVMVIVRTSPVMVCREMVGVGIHVDEDEDESAEVVTGGGATVDEDEAAGAVMEVYCRSQHRTPKGPVISASILQISEGV